MVRGRLRSVGGVLVLGALAFLASSMGASAGAEPVIVPRDADGNVVVELTAAGGGLSGKITVVNPTVRALTVRITGKDDIAQCKFAPATLAPSSSTEVAVRSARCHLDKNGGSAVMTFTGRPSSSVPVSLALKDVAKPVSLGASSAAFALAGVLALVLVLASWWFGKTMTGGAGPVRRAWNDQLTGIPDGWDFKDSWATNVGAVSTVFVGIFGTNDVIKALVGEESETLPGRLLIIAAIAALLIGLAPLAAKAIGPTGSATVLGLVVGAWLVTTAVAGEILAVYTAFGIDDPSGAVWGDFWGGFGADGALVVTLVLLAFLGAYVFRTLKPLLEPGTDPPPKPSDELLIASATLVAAEVCCDDARRRDPEPELLELAHLRAVNYLVALRTRATAPVPAEKGRPREAGVAAEPADAAVSSAFAAFADFGEVARTAGRSRSALL